MVFIEFAILFEDFQVFYRTLQNLTPPRSIARNHREKSMRVRAIPFKRHDFYQIYKKNGGRRPHFLKKSGREVLRCIKVPCVPMQVRANTPKISKHEENLNSLKSSIEIIEINVGNLKKIEETIASDLTLLKNAGILNKVTTFTRNNKEK